MIGIVYKRLIQVGKVSGAVSLVLGAVIAAPYALIQYLQSREANRVEQALNAYKQYNSPPFIDYREKIYKTLTKNRLKVEEAATNEGEFLRLQLQMIKDEDMESELNQLFDFFDWVGFCVANHICDDVVAIKLFQRPALVLYLNFYQYMIVRRATTPTRDFGAGLEAIASPKNSK